MTFRRKLRMMRADIFTLLSISMNKDFIKSAGDSKILKLAILKFLEGEDNERVKRMKVFETL